MLVSEFVVFMTSLQSKFYVLSHCCQPFVGSLHLKMLATFITSPSETLQMLEEE
jgi:hypothetical protein